MKLLQIKKLYAHDNFSRKIRSVLYTEEENINQLKIW